MTFADIERNIVDYFDQHKARVEERGAEWFLVDDEGNTVSLTGLAAAILKTTQSTSPRSDPHLDRW